MRPRVGKAEQSLRSAELLLAAGDLDGEVNRAYYACYDAARGVLEAVSGLDTREVKTHSGLIRLFNLRVVKAGLMPLEIGRLIGREEQLRLFADYGDGVHERSEAELAVRQAADFLAACVGLIRDKSNEQS
ncbi:HEPN domain-containing protein [Bosea sp. (in: a-proteobacteria)]|uniref:HEPN domain-containing protein n=1 Tax=Bosea sp. (in: a-proteobacteria) TaxID=1871050 RepID=UPI002FC98A3E